MLRKTPHDRRGFSLVEVLVVVAILAIIVAIAAGAYFAIMGGQQNDASRAAVAKIDGLLLQKIKAIRDRIKDDIREKRPNTGYNELKTAGLTSEAAEAVLLYSRMKNELPMTIAEATTPFTIPFTSIVLQPRAEFRGLSGTTTPHLESAICLYRALAQFPQDGFEQLVMDSGHNSEKCYKDNKGKPIIFNRLAFSGDQNELNAAPYAKGYDPFFPKKLPAGTYQNLSVELGAVNTVTFWTAVTPAPAVKTYWGIPLTYPGLVFHTSCAISFGQQGQDVNDPGTFPAMYANGNIVSFRLRAEGAKGD